MTGDVTFESVMRLYAETLKPPVYGPYKRQCDNCRELREVKLLPCGDHWHYLCDECGRNKIQ